MQLDFFLASYVNALTSTIYNMYGFTACLSLIRSKILPKNQAHVNWFLALKLTGITLYGALVSIYCSNVKSCIRWCTGSHLAFLPLQSFVPALMMSSTPTYQPSGSNAVQAICMSKLYAWGLEILLSTRENAKKINNNHAAITINNGINKNNSWDLNTQTT